MMNAIRTGSVVVASLVLAAGSIAPAAGQVAGAERNQAKQILEATGVTGGVIVQLGCGDGRLTAALRTSDRFVVQGLDADAKNVEAARRYIQSLGLYGKVSVQQWSSARLPYVDNLVNLVVSEHLGEIPMDEVMRVLVPLGVAYVRQGGRWTKTVKPWPKAIDEWTHFMHGPDNNAVAHDMLVGPPKSMQWVAGPLYCRSHEIDSGVSALVSARGRLFYILDEGPIGVADQRLPEKWALIARDAFNGVLLWKRPVPHWGWPEWKKEQLAGKEWTKLRAQRLNFPAALPKRLVADGDRLYVTLGFHAPVTQIDAVTGATLQSYAGTENADEIVCSDGTLVICVRANTGGSAKDSILAVDALTGRILWRRDALQVMPLSLAVDAGRVVFNNRPDIVCLDLKTGAPQWRATGQVVQARKGRGPEGVAEGWQWHVWETLVIHDGVVLLQSNTIRALSLQTGKLLWTAPTEEKGNRYDLAPDLFVADGLAWYGTGQKGLDLHTGEVKRTIDLMNLISVGHHPRCYPGKATDRYLIRHKQGAEFVDLVGGTNHMRNDWMRGPCRYGVMPCNGLLYAPPHQCKCYAGVKLNGFNALASRRAGGAAAVDTDRLERGPAYEALAPRQAFPVPRSDWPTYRHDAARSGASASSAPTSMRSLWHVEPGGKLSQPVVAGGRLLVASLEADRVCCFDAETGTPLWSFTAGGRVDSPPTVYRGLALFGSADGWVYALRASDGALAWRFRAAPDRRRVVAFGALESPWPVHGSVLVQDDVAYVAAGRSTFLDGGIYLSALDPTTGKLLHEAHLEGPYPDIVHDPGGSGFMDGATSDVLTGDGSFVYMRQITFDAALRPQKPAVPMKPSQPRDVGLHLMASSNLLDDSGFNRIGWTYGRRWPIGLGSPILAFNSTATYGVQPFTKHEGQSQVYFPGTGCIELFSSKNNAPQQPKPSKQRKRAFASRGAVRWSVIVPVLVRAMVLTDNTLFIAGVPDVLDPEDPLAALEGRKGGELWAVSTADGKKLAGRKLDSAPIFDGMIAAGGRLYVSTLAGQVVCLGE